ncbi:MAG: prepilin-type N-terminal cleavage/methylation domain-containing protein, partial [Planctomycetaceae bacterium]|nr:prepilin-type N-terminal cleavage/methylation domain-containing protein [Planctomycetaceae bacterium]
MKKLPIFCFGYTLVELLIAITLSLFLLLGVTEMFRHVGSTMSDTQKSLNMSANLNAVAMTLRGDLGKIDPVLAHQPYQMTQPGYTTDAPGYLEITEGMNAPYSVIMSTANGLHVPIKDVALNPDTVSDASYGSWQGIDQTVGDVDDILAFTAQADPAYPFRGLVGDVDGDSIIDINGSNFAEIIWFVRGTTLYRRVLLIDENDQWSPTNYADYDISIHCDTVPAIKTSMMASGIVRSINLRENRFGHYKGTFPYPLYSSTNEGWYYLRMPTLEETVHSLWSVGRTLPLLTITSSTSPPPYWDFWWNPNGFSGGIGSSSLTWTQDPDSGSIVLSDNSAYTNPRHSRAGEDIVLKNVISFDVKVWNPYWVPYSVTRGDSTVGWLPPQYIDLGQDDFQNPNSTDPADRVYVNYAHNFVSHPSPNGAGGYGFTLKGRYNTSNNNRRTGSTDEWFEAERFNVALDAGG